MANTFNNAQLELTTSTQTLYQASTATGAVSIVLSVLVANIDGTNAADVTVQKTDSSDTDQSYIAWTIPVPADSALELIPNKLVLKSGEKLRGLASAAGDLDVTISVLEITP